MSFADDDLTRCFDLEIVIVHIHGCCWASHGVHHSSHAPGTPGGWRPNEFFFKFHKNLEKILQDGRMLMRAEYACLLKGITLLPALAIFAVSRV